MFDLGEIKLRIEQKRIFFTRKEVIEPVLKNVLLCGNVHTDSVGRNTYQDEFKTIYVSNIPDVKSEFFLVTKWGDGQGKKFKQEVKIVDPVNSLEIFNSVGLESEFKLVNVYHEHIIVGQIFDLFLPMVGRYCIEIYLNGRLKGKTYFNVIQLGPK
ncbi:MAG: hypothetical protein PHW46_06795 [Candidatus Omnitrophica bacterium]|nr:hypothetical protein [Candidatus Omnitrophota bacterium]